MARRHYVPEKGKQMPSGRGGRRERRRAEKVEMQRVEKEEAGPTGDRDGLYGLDRSKPPVTDQEAREAFSKMGSKELYAIYAAGTWDGRRLDRGAWSDLGMYLFDAWRKEGYGVARAARANLHEEMAYFQEAGYDAQFFPHHGDSEIEAMATGKRPPESEYQDYTILYTPKLIGGPKHDPERMIAKLRELEATADRAQVGPQYVEMVRRWREIVEFSRDRKEDYPGAYSNNTIDYNFIRGRHSDVFHRLPGSAQGTAGLESARLYEIVVDRELDKWRAETAGPKVVLRAIRNEGIDAYPIHEGRAVRVPTEERERVKALLREREIPFTVTVDPETIEHVGPGMETRQPYVLFHYGSGEGGP